MKSKNSFFLSETADWSGYDNLRTEDSARKFRAYLEELWAQWRPYADPHFRQECLRSEEKFNQRLWEMFLGAALLERGKSFAATKGGPDICLEEGSQRIWIEAVAPTPGKGSNAVPAVIYEEAQYDPDTGQPLPLTGRGTSASEVEDPIKLRYLAAVRNKYCCRDNSRKRRGILPYIARDKTRTCDPVIVAVNSANIDQEWPSALMPAITKACFGIGVYQHHLEYNPQTQETISRGTGYTRQETAGKLSRLQNSRIEIDSSIFLTAKYRYISAILFSYACLKRMPFAGDLMLIHNPFAKNPLPHGFIADCEDTWLEDVQLEGQRIVKAKLVRSRN